MASPGSREGLPERGGDLLDRALGGIEHIYHADEAVDEPGIARDRHGNARLGQPLRVRFALVAERIVLRGDHEGGREAADILGEKRRGVGLPAVLGLREVVAPKPLHALTRTAGSPTPRRFSPRMSAA